MIVKKIMALVLAVMMLVLFMACGKKHQELDEYDIQGENSDMVSAADETSPAEEISKPDADIISILIGTWEYPDDPLAENAFDFVTNIVFEADGSFVFHGYWFFNGLGGGNGTFKYEVEAVGKYEVKDGLVNLEYDRCTAKNTDSMDEYGVGLTSDYDHVAMYDASTEVLTVYDKCNYNLSIESNRSVDDLNSQTYKKVS